MSPKKYVHPLLTVLSGEVATVIFRGMMTVVCFYGGIFYSHAKDLYLLPDKVSVEIAKVNLDLKEFESAQAISKAEVEKSMSQWYAQRDSMQRMLDQHERTLNVMSGQVTSILESLTKIGVQLNTSVTK